MVKVIITYAQIDQPDNCITDNYKKLKHHDYELNNWRKISTERNFTRPRDDVADDNYGKHLMPIKC